MAEKIALLVDTDIFIDHLNSRLFRDLFEADHFKIHYSIMTKKELLSKQGLSHADERSIRDFLKNFRIIPLNQQILYKHSELLVQHPTLYKADCLIAATAIISKLPLVTRNYKHFRQIKELVLYFTPQPTP